jgi:hypothetical protein
MSNLRNIIIGLVVFVVVVGLGYTLFRSSSQTVLLNDPVDQTEEGRVPTPTQRIFEIVELLPPDAIPSIDDPEFYSADQADSEYDPNEMVLGVSINGDTRAYSTSLLDRHEIVNDEVGGRKITVTW